MAVTDSAVGTRSTLVLTARIVQAQVKSHAVTPDNLVELIKKVHGALLGAAYVGAERAMPGPAVDPTKSVQDDRIICLNCGKSCLVLRRHLRERHDLTPVAYRKMWGLRYDYPIVAKNYGKAKSKLPTGR